MLFGFAMTAQGGGNAHGIRATIDGTTVAENTNGAKGKIELSPKGVRTPLPNNQRLQMSDLVD